jgi:hypothetical protein
LSSASDPINPPFVLTVSFVGGSVAKYAWGATDLKVFIAIACGLAMLLPPPVLADDGAVISEIVVTSQRRPQSRLGHAGNIDQLDAATLQRMQHHHISELLHRVPGAWIVRGSGQEHQTALRSPVRFSKTASRCDPRVSAISTS